MIINLKDIELINHIYLHDMKLLDISIDYAGHKVNIILFDEQEKTHTLIFDNMQNFSINRFEPWGEGAYVNEIKAITSCLDKVIDIGNECVIDNEAFVTEVLLNSGDKIEILSTQIQFI